MNSPRELSLNDILPVCDPIGLGARATRRNDAHQLARELLTEHWPALALLKAGACEDTTARESLLRALRTLDKHKMRIDTHRAIDDLIRFGNKQGLWTLAPFPSIAQHALAPSVVSMSDSPLIKKAILWRTLLSEGIAALVVHADPQVKLGAATLALALESAVLHTSLVQDFLGPEVARIALPDHLHLSVKNGKRVRSCVLSRVSRHFWGEAQQKRRPTTNQLNRALQAAANVLGKQMPTTLQELLSGARRFWAIHLPPALYRLTTDPQSTAGLAVDVLHQRVLKDKPLTRAQARRSNRQILRSQHSNWHAGQARARAGSSADQDHAWSALKKVLDRSQGREPTSDLVRQRLQDWRDHHGKCGGWISLMADWIRHALSDLRMAGNDRALRASSVRRYLHAFGGWILELAGDLDPSNLDEMTFMDRLEVLELVSIEDSSNIRRMALQEFLDFSACFGMTQIDLDDWWPATTSDGAPDANLITPREFKRVMAQLDRHFAHIPFTFNLRRARAISILAFRAGLRWGELCFVSVGDIRVLGRGAWRGVTLRVVRSKTANGIRELPLHQLLPPDELNEVLAYLGDLRNGVLGARQNEALLFADVDRPDRTPLREYTHTAIQQAMRRVTGDDSLVFHHLRHSCGTLLLLRLLGLLDHGPLARQLGHDSPWLPLEMRSFLQWVGGNEDRHAAGQVAAVLLGHLDVHVTLAHYQHLSEWLIAHSTSHAPLKLSIAARARLQDIKPASVSRQDHRNKNRPHQPRK